MFGVRDDSGQRVRWLSMFHGDARVVGTEGSRVWLSVSGILDEGPAALAVVDLAKSTTQSCVVLGGERGAVEAADGGLAFKSYDEPESNHHFSWPELNQERSAADTRPTIRWRPVVEGVEYGVANVLGKSAVGDGLFHLVRIDPSLASLWAFGVGTRGAAAARTAAAWSQANNLVVAFNAGMFEPDHVTHTGAFEFSGYGGTSTWVPKYKSALVRYGRGDGHFEILDVDDGEVSDFKIDLLVQNLRLIRRPGVNVWPPSKRQWSELALAATATGELLVVFSRTPLSMRDFNQALLGLGLSVQAAMHLEGGPEASLSVHGGGVDVDLCGSYETGFVENDSNVRQWPLPNIFGVERPAHDGEPSPGPNSP